MKILAQNILEVIEKAFNNRFNAYISLFICLWGSLFIELWKRKNSKLAYQWDVNNYEDTEPDRPDFYGTKLILVRFFL